MPDSTAFASDLALAVGAHALSLQITTFAGVEPDVHSRTSIGSDATETRVCVKDSEWSVSLRVASSADRPGAWTCTAEFLVLSGRLPNANVAVGFDFQEWSTDRYVLVPAAAYNGNRYRSLPKKYPPMLHAEDGIGADMPVTITDVPRLNDGAGPSRLHLRSGDMATPCVGIRAPSRERGFLLLAEHDTPFGYTGFLLEESADRRTARLRLEAPAVRCTMYGNNRTDNRSDDRGHDFSRGDRITLPFALHLFPCPDIPALFTRFFEIRQELTGQPAPVHELPFSTAFRIIEDKYLRHQWNGEQGYFRVDVVEKDNPFSDWQAGWVGGGMSTLAFLSDGVPLSRERSRKTLDTIFSTLQAPNGWIFPIMHRGTLLGDDFCHQANRNIVLVRKDADVLLFAARQVLLLAKRGERIPASWHEGLRRLADAFVRLWERHGQFGQFVDIGTDDILMGGTACGSSAPGGLALAGKVLGDGRCLEVAIASARSYRDRCLRRGLLNGGPGEILQNADSESAFNLLESLVTLSEVTGDAAWLDPAEECARLCASWCVSYDFHFPEGSEFARLGVRSTGSVFASVQNKHSAPGICTLSGVSLLKLYRATGNPLYLRLCREIAHGITQYLSREDRPVRSCDNGNLEPGWMCERVNLSDWETKANIGAVFHGSNWCEVSCLLTYTEIPGAWLLTDSGEVFVFDHVEARVTGQGDSWRLALANPTRFDADVKVLAEPRISFGVPWGESVLEGCPVVRVPAGGGAELVVPKDRSVRRREVVRDVDG